MDIRVFRTLFAAAVACAITAVSCNDGGIEGTRVTLVNGTTLMVRSIILVAGTDTLKADTLFPGASASWRILLEPEASMVLTWVEGTESRSMSPSLLDSANRAEELELNMLAGELDLEVSYHF
jgi:hypothetical protein